MFEIAAVGGWTGPPPPVPPSCTDQYGSCFRWASQGPCETLSSFMNVRCPLSCGRCESAHILDPCTPVEDTVGPGSIAKTFARALTLEKHQPSLINSDPPIILLDEFTIAAADIAASAERVGGFGSPGSSCAFNPSTCNSSSMSCLPVDGSACWEDPTLRDLEKQMLEVVNLPAENCEPLRFVRYRSSQSFGPHHDAQGQSGIAPHTPGGPRVWTLYVFLSAPDAGGALRFPALNLSVDARAGRAVLWPHLLDDDLATVDERTVHEGVAVKEGGYKMGVNLHCHRSNLRTRVLAGCESTGLSHVFNYESAPGASPLHDAIGFHAIGAVAELIGAGADVDAADAKGQTPLHVAAGRGQLQAMAELLGAKANIAAADVDGATPLHEATFQGQAQAIELLLSAGAPINAAAKFGATALHLAAKHGMAEAAKVLLAHGADVHAANSKGAAPLHLAARHGHPVVIEALVAGGAAVDARDAVGATPLHSAAAEDQEEAVRALARAGAPLDAAAGRGMTALHLCAVLGKPAALAALIEAGADVHATERTGATALHLATSKGYDELVAALRKANQTTVEVVSTVAVGALVLWLCAVIGRRVRERAR